MTVIVESLLNLSHPQTLLLMTLGVAWGILLGAMPGFGATLGMAILIPFTFGMDPLLALPMLAGIYAGAIYGGGITAILVGVPGTSAAAATVLDGYPMTLNGQSSRALTTSVYASSFGGAVGGVSLLLFAPLLAQVTLLFGPAEYFMLAVFGLTMIATVAGDSKTPERFGTGDPEGVAAAEAANNATEGGSLVPMLTLSIPGSSAAAIMFGALMIHGMQPGPDLFTKHAETTYTFIWAVILSNVIMLLLGYFGSRYFAKLASVPVVVLVPVMLLVTLLGAFAYRQLVFDVGLTIVIGSVCYLLTLARFPMPPILLGLILGPIAERGFRLAMLISQGDWTIFLSRPSDPQGVGNRCRWCACA